MSKLKYDQCPPAKLWKQFAAMFYDSLLLVAILFVGTAALLPFNQGEAVSGPLFHLYLILLVFVFYSGFWSKSGQTLGMKVWKLKIITDYGFYPSWPISFLRLFTTIVFPLTFLVVNHLFSLIEDTYLIVGITLFIFLAGYLNRLIQPCTWHDRVSQTRIIDVSSISVENSG